MSTKPWLDQPSGIEEGQSGSGMLAEASKETRALRDVLHNSRRVGGNYGTLAKSKLQQTFYIPHQVNPDDTLQRLALKYGINIQEIKRVNKLWSDAELCLSKCIYIPVDSVQLSVLRNEYPTLEFVQSVPLRSDNNPRSSISSSTTDEIVAPNQSLDSLSATINTNSTVQDYLSKIDQQIKLTKQTLQSLSNTVDQHSKSVGGEASRSHIPPHDSANSDTFTQTNMCNNDRYGRKHELSDEKTVLNSTKQSSREKYKSLALERIQHEQESIDDL